MGMPAARIGDMHVCPMVTPGIPPIPHVGGPILPPCAVTVLTGKIPQARVTDMAVCVGPPDIIVKGSMGVMVCKLPAARIADLTAHGGTIVVGLPTVLIGETKPNGGAVMAPMMGMAMAQHGGDATAAVALTHIDEDMQAGTLVSASQDGTPFCEMCLGGGKNA